MRKILLLLLLLAATLPMSSCRRAAEKARQKIRVEAVEKFEMHGMSGAELALRVVNDTRHKLVLEKVEMDVFYNGSRVGSVALRDRIEVGKRTTESVSLLWQFKIADPLALYVLSRKVQESDLSQVCVSYAIEGRGGPMSVKISKKMVPLSEFLHNFGLTMDTLKSYMKP